jgi:hypothetical protein
MERTYPIFVPPEHIKEGDMEHYAVVDWCYEHLSDSTTNALILTLEDIYLLQYKSEILDIINEENDSMLMAFEDDWIYSPEVKLKILVRLKEYQRKISIERVKSIAHDLIKLLEVSIQTNGNMYFLF